MDMTEIRDGHWAGWRFWPNDTFEVGVGPFYNRTEADGSSLSAFHAEARHMNGGGAMHGGCMLAFADYALFAIGSPALQDGRGVTVSLNGEFVGPAYVGDLVEARGEIVRAGGSLVFIRGLISRSLERTPMMAFSGVIKKLRLREAEAGLTQA